jgi:hypothetical protein
MNNGHKICCFFASFHEANKSLTSSSHKTSNMAELLFLLFDGKKVILQ